MLQDISMIKTKHCQIRQKQRHITDSMLELALTYGHERKNTDKITLRKNELNQLYDDLLDLIDRLENYVNQ